MHWATPKLCRCLPKIHKRSYSQTGKYFITSPIFYVNSSPHIGHAYTTLLADAQVRFQKLLGAKQVGFSVGTDEHGLKIQKAAAHNLVKEDIFCEKISNDFRSVFNRVNVQYSDFIRTVEKRHKECVSNFWNVLRSKDLIYKTTYEGYYCVSDEVFLKKSHLESITLPDGTMEHFSVDSGHLAHWTSEDNYMFKLSKFTEDLKYWLKQDGVIKPAKFQKQMLSLLHEPLHDISISRPAHRLWWGIPVPNDQSQTIYVWFDALLNYWTVSKTSFQNNWPPDCHVIGKDILKFHAIFWPAFLIGAGLEPPRSIFCHSHWMVNEEKMSKSKGNVINPIELIDKFTSEGFRYFVLRQGTPHTDCSFNEKLIMEVLNHDLSHVLGNLLSRSTAPSLNVTQTFVQYDQKLCDIYGCALSRDLMSHLQELPTIVEEHFSEFNYYRGIDKILEVLRKTNVYVNETKPWEMKKSNSDNLKVVIHLVLESLRISAILLQPIIPILSKNILDKLNIPSDARMWKDACSPSWKSKYEEYDLAAEKIILFKSIRQNT